MKRKSLVLSILLILLLCGVLGFVRMQKGFSARDQPSGLERLIARQARQLAAPKSARELKNPLPLTPELLAAARAHFADHCALCHGNDGRGKTEIGRNLYPKAPDMTLADTQGLSDGELFSIIKNGIRLTGMPAWGADTPQDDHASWKIVHLIRHFPKMTAAEMREMAAMNPVSPMEMKEQSEEEKFLEVDGESLSPSHEMQNHKP